MTDEPLKALNLSLWKEWSLKASEINCFKLCSVVVDDDTSRQFMRYIQGYEVSPEISTLIRRISTGDYIPTGLDCTLNGVPQRTHLMYKIEPLEHPSGNARYEFLIEYDRMEPTVGIYMGCKCITLANADHRRMIDVYLKEWNELRYHIFTVLNNSFPEKEFRLRFRVTDNGENKTFWPSWIGLYDDEDMDFALTVLRIIRKSYEQYFNSTLKECRRLAPISYKHVKTAFTESAFSELTETIGNIYSHRFKDNAIEFFNKFILNAS